MHVYACFWYLTSQDNIGQRFKLLIGTWYPNLNDDGSYDEDYDDAYHMEGNKTVFRTATYSMAFHQAVLMIMGESMDNETNTEIWVSSLLMIIGAILMAIVFGEVSMYITNFYASTNLFQKKMTDLYESMEALHLPQNLQERIHLFYKYVWDEHHSIDGRPAILTFVPELSTNLAKEIYLYLFSDMITKVPMFHNRPADVVQHLVLSVQTLIYMPKDYVIVKGEFGQEMFFIQSGKCDVIIEVIVEAAEVEEQVGKLKSTVFTNIVKSGLGFSKQRKVADYPGRERSDSVFSTDSGRFSTGSSMRASNRTTSVEFKLAEKVVKELETGDYFGEIALITDSRRTASIRSRTFTELLLLSRDDFLRITENNQAEREAMKAQIRQRYNDKSVTIALKEKKKNEKKKDKRGKHTFLNLHSKSRKKHAASNVDLEITELKSQVKKIEDLTMLMHSGMKELLEMKKMRKPKTKRKTKRKVPKNGNEDKKKEGDDEGKLSASCLSSGPEMSAIEKRRLSALHEMPEEEEEEEEEEKRKQEEAAAAAVERDRGEDGEMSEVTNTTASPSSYSGSVDNEYRKKDEDKCDNKDKDEDEYEEEEEEEEEEEGEEDDDDEESGSFESGSTSESSSEEEDDDDNDDNDVDKDKDDNGDDDEKDDDTDSEKDLHDKDK